MTVFIEQPTTGLLMIIQTIAADIVASIDTSSSLIHSFLFLSLGFLISGFVSVLWHSYGILTYRKHVENLHGQSWFLKQHLGKARDLFSLCWKRVNRTAHFQAGLFQDFFSSSIFLDCSWVKKLWKGTEQ